MSSSSSSHINVFFPDQVCYVNCIFCNTVLVVNVPSNNSSDVVAVRCGLCANILYVSLQAFLGKLPLRTLQGMQNPSPGCHQMDMDCGTSSCSSSSSSSSSKRARSMDTSADHNRHQMQLNLIHTTEKRRLPSAYNIFVKEEIRRLKAKNPKMSHREAFSTAAKNWAHFPEIHLGLAFETNGADPI